ncbi:FAD-dependent oxidoreductase [Piscinibacter sakaiensis]|uniref:FAD-dependent oxidoreductase n=1 Tax=Piscinibacter sakaiensis TaxID=1547922 RepID=UPI003AAFC236
MQLEQVDVVVIGAGPAGMSAAIAASDAGASVVLLDEQATPGGQIYRAVTESDPQRLALLGPDYAAGGDLAKAFAASGARYERGVAVWEVTREHRVNGMQNGGVRAWQAKRVVLATGAMERPFPIPGWTLPGVMTAGAAQILLKTTQAVPQDGLVLAGCGPLLYLLGWQYLRAGVKIRAIVDTTERADYLRAARHAGGALRGWPMLAKGLKLMAALRAAKIPFHSGASDLAVEGSERAQALRFKIGGREQRIDADVVLLHQGVVPNTQISWSLRAEHDWDDEQLCWRPQTSAWYELSTPGIFIAGDGAGIGGALAAATQGRLAGLEVARQCDHIDEAQRDRLAAPLRQELSGQLAIRPFLDALYRPKHRVPADSVTVCRCEEVTAGDIRAHVDLGCSGPNQAKAFGRCGMGPCQGRMCGLTVTEVIADARKVAPAEVGYYRIRPPIKPVTLGGLARES